MAKNQHDLLCAALSYILVGIIWYFLDSKMQKDYVKFHVKQGIVLLLFSIIWGIVLSVVLLPLLGWLFILGWILTVLGYVPLVYVILGILNALNRKQHVLPIIGQYAKGLNF